MTDAEINEKIALRRGWKYNPYTLGILKWESPPVMGFGNGHEHPPDYLHDWAHAGPLWVELMKRDPDEIAFGAAEEIVLDEVLIIMEELDCSWEKAISLAWLAWQEERDG